MLELRVPSGAKTAAITPMLLDLRQMRGAHDRFERMYDASAFDSGREGYVVAGDATLALDIHKDRDQYRLVGQLRTALELSCCRCLDRFVRSVDLAFDLLYLPQADNRGEGEVEIKDDDLATAYYRENQIDIGQLMREQFYLSLPMKPLCGDACLGLCPVCGTNLNQGTCSCARAWEDPRWAGLKALRDDDVGT